MHVTSQYHEYCHDSDKLHENPGSPKNIINVIDPLTVLCGIVVMKRPLYMT